MIIARDGLSRFKIDMIFGTSILSSLGKWRLLRLAGGMGKIYVYLEAGQVYFSRVS